MTKTLSEQLCEIVGLEYKKEYSYFVKKYPDREYSEAVTKEVEGVLNFEQPENFVKLMELPLAEANITVFLITVLKKINGWEHVPWNRKSYLELLLLVIQESAISPKWQDSIKQSIRDYDGWVWE